MRRASEPARERCRVRRALEADIGPVLVACGDKDIFDVVCDAGGDAVLTDPNHNSGSDRIYEESWFPT